MKSSLAIQCFTHVPFEGPAVIADWSEEHKHKLQITRFYENDPLPDPGKTDMLVVMGGPMNAFDYPTYPWLEEETEWVKQIISAGKPVIGICLGAQILAIALGAEVHPGPHKEIGWFNLRFLPCLGDYRICHDLPPMRKVFHWHGDTFSLPEGADRIAESKAFANQGFIYDSRVIALQFHLEVKPSSVKALVKNCGEELVDGPYIQDAGTILNEKAPYRDNQKLMHTIMDYLANQVT